MEIQIFYSNSILNTKVDIKDQGIVSHAGIEANVVNAWQDILCVSS